MLKSLQIMLNTSVLTAEIARMDLGQQMQAGHRRETAKFQMMPNLGLAGNKTQGNSHPESSAYRLCFSK